MSRKAMELHCSEKDKQALEKLVNSGKTEKRLHNRCRIILCCLEGKTNLEVAEHLKINRLTVSKWRNRFHKQGLNGLYDSERSGKPITPTSASRLNQVEIWFGILSRKALKNGSFTSVESLSKVIEDFVEAYQAGAKPFIWRKREVKGSQLRNTIVNLRN